MFVKKRNDIQILRALAVIFVVLFHLEVAGIESGFLGVDIFFVVSGFLMAVLYTKGENKKFFERRAKRLLPAYFATVLATFLASIFITLPPELGQVATQSIYSLFFANNIGFWLQNSYFSKADFNPLLHLWSLSVEIQFYLIVPIIAWLFLKSKSILHLLFISSFLICIFVVGISPKTSFFMMPLRIWEFLIGFYIAYYLTKKGNIKTEKYQWLGLIGLIFLCAIPFISVDGDSLNRLKAHPSFYALIICLATSLVLSFGLPKILQESTLGKILVKIGDYSYSVYLVHFPIIALYLYKPFSGTILKTESYIDKAILLLLITAASFAMHKYIEKREYNISWKYYIACFVSVFFLQAAAMTATKIIYDKNDQNIFASLKDVSIYRCGKLNRITNPSSISCKINSEDFDQSVFLVGNSHADSIKQAFGEFARQKNINTYFTVSNNPLTKESLPPKELVKESIKLGINHIVLHYSPNFLKIDTLKELLEITKEKDIKLDLILPVPVYEDSIPKLLYLNEFNSMDVQDYLKHHEEYFTQVMHLQKQYPSFTSHEVHDILCKPECAIKSIDGKPYYFDSNHLTLTGAKILTPIFENILK